MHQPQTLIQKAEVGIEVRPMIVIPFRQNPLVRLARVFTPSNAGRIFPVGKEWRIGVNERNSILIFRQEGGHDGQVIAKDQTIVGDGVWIAVPTRIDERIPYKGSRLGIRLLFGGPIEDGHINNEYPQRCHNRCRRSYRIAVCIRTSSWFGA